MIVLRYSNRKGQLIMSRRTNELVKAISPKKKQVSKKTQVATWFKTQVWDSRPINWLAIGISYVAIAFASYELAKYYIGVPEINGVAAFVSTIAIGSRAFRK